MIHTTEPHRVKQLSGKYVNSKVFPLGGARLNKVTVEPLQADYPYIHSQAIVLAGRWSNYINFRMSQSIFP